MSKSQKVKTSKPAKMTGATIGIRETVCGSGFMVTYKHPAAHIDMQCRRSSLRSARAAVTRFRNKYGEPDAFEVEQDLWEKLNLPLL